jgi:alanyl-tRNA synthetase
LRFDFSFPRALTKDELKQVEAMINKRVGEGYDVWFEVLDRNEADKVGALAFFGEKYGKKVNVYFIGKKGERDKAFSKEFCGGPHVTNTKDVGHVTITKEESAGSGIRRIYATIQPSS